jgi:hypothetical protein
VLLNRVATTLHEEPTKIGDSSSTVPDLTDDLIDSLYRQVQKQRKEMGKKANYITEGKKIINPHIPGN